MESPASPTAAHVVVRTQGGELVVPVSGRLFVGRECHGVDPEQRLVIEDNEVSRNHLEIRLDPQSGRASLIDTSSNGTRLNGARIERGAPERLRDGDRIRLGATELEFQTRDFRPSTAGIDLRATSVPVRLARMAIAVGDIVGYSTISERAETPVLSQAVGRLFGDLRALLRRHQGTVGNYAGDALFALWELEHFDDATDRALGFALEACELVRELAPELPIRDPDGAPISMGWGVVEGEAATTSIGGVASSVLGDSANLAFRLSGVAGRDERPLILVTEATLAGITVPHDRDAGTQLTVKGRAGAELVFGVGRPSPG